MSYQSAYTGTEIDAALQLVIDRLGTVTNEDALVTAAAVYAALSEKLGKEETAATAEKLAEAVTVRTNLASTTAASFDGSADITPGVTGTLPVSRGGTGKTTLTSGYFLKGNGTSAVTVQSAANARSAMGLGSSTGTLGVAYGGTGGTDVNAAARNLIERGSWTPQIGFLNGATFNVTYTKQYGTYLKVGDMVTVAWDMTFTASGSWLEANDYIHVVSLPYAPEMDRWCGVVGQLIIPGITYNASGYACHARTSISGIAHRTLSGAAVSVSASNTGTFYLAGTMTYKIS